MGKTIKILAGALTMTMLATSGVTALEYTSFSREEAKLVDQLFEEQNRGKAAEANNANGANGGAKAAADQNGMIEPNVIYKSFATPEFYRTLKRYDEAQKSVAQDADVVGALGTARCVAQFRLDELNRQICATRKLMELAEGIKRIDTYRYKRSRKTSDPNEPYQFYRNPVPVITDAVLSAARIYALDKDAQALDKLIKTNAELASKNLNEKPKYEALGIEYMDRVTGRELKDNVLAIRTLIDKKIMTPLYRGLIEKLMLYYGNKQIADHTVGELTRQAKVEAAKIHLLEAFAKQKKFSLRSCPLCDYGAKVTPLGVGAAELAEKIKQKDPNKDDVPNTAAAVVAVAAAPAKRFAN
ncbi:hypothetical protein HMPREF0868_0188 [Mageeibacillus indolicus UPII9-5]|uniref:Uncharacterized protein n=1 Tax=Mageeibacillus indolicus (strain UPII9-5) TaxID=699246 RepID=D3R022_MAGIU|nr:hypothetical protein [Mageeibacillus indolicus]ADC91402.1 hypothetical protein HMPREF0868_0188 [Mageeibacillus indolicus UPII9-5]